jgi:hypothetical protein
MGAFGMALPVPPRGGIKVTRPPPLTDGPYFTLILPPHWSNRDFLLIGKSDIGPTGHCVPWYCNLSVADSSIIACANHVTFTSVACWMSMHIPPLNGWSIPILYLVVYHVMETIFFAMIFKTKMKLIDYICFSHPEKRYGQVPLFDSPLLLQNFLI